MTDISPNVIDHLTASERFRTQARLADAAGVKQHSISGRRKVNSLSHDQMRRLLKVAPEYGVTLTPADFFPELSANDAAAQDRAA